MAGKRAAEQGASVCGVLRCAPTLRGLSRCLPDPCRSSRQRARAHAGHTGAAGDARVGAAASPKVGAVACSSHSLPGMWATDAMAAYRCKSAARFFLAVA
eukprot:scaffold11357_cov61-Phaeocystis_antarctica.AAC.1